MMSVGTFGKVSEGKPTLGAKGTMREDVIYHKREKGKLKKKKKKTVLFVEWPRAEGDEGYNLGY
jgi:hypothetical protein